MPTLSYQSATSRPLVRFWRLAIGSFLVALAGLLPLLGHLFAFRLLANFGRLSPWWLFALSLPDITSAILLLPAVILLATVLPGVDRRMKFFTCLNLAVFSLLATTALALAGAFTKTHDISYLRVILALNTLCLILQLALLIAGILFLLHIGKSLGKRPLGLIAAIGMVPCVLCMFLVLLQDVLVFLGVYFSTSGAWSYKLNHWMPFKISDAYIVIVSPLVFLVWSAVALTAAIFALKSRRA